MIRAYRNESVTRHPWESTDQWGVVTFGSNETIKVRVIRRNVVTTNVQAEEVVSRNQLLMTPSQAVDARDEFTVDGVRLSVVEIKRNDDFVARVKEVRLV